MKVEIEIVRIPVDRSRARELAETIESRASRLPAPPRCSGRRSAVTGDDGDEVTAIVRWSSAEAHEAGARGSESASFFKTVMALASGPPEVRKYDARGRELMSALPDEVALVHWRGERHRAGRRRRRFVAEGCRVCVADINAMDSPRSASRWAIA